MKSTCAILALTAAVSLLGGCEADESAPRRPRTNSILAPDNKAQDNAFQRENEAPKRDLPTEGKEFPGQTKAAPAGTTPATAALPAVSSPPVITADAVNPPPQGAAPTRKGPVAGRPVPLNGTDSCIPETRYPPVGWYPGPLPNLPPNPGSAAMVGSTPAAGTAWSIDYSWGQVTTLENFLHRPWPETQANYVAAEVKHNTPYFFNIQNRLAVPQNDSTLGGNWLSNAIELPWFTLESIALPVMLFVECPLQQVTSQRLGQDPNYLGYLPADGPIAPVPVPGVISWEYPFLQQTPNEAASAPAERPIAATPGLPPVTAGTSLGAPAPAPPRQEPPKYPGLR